MKTFLTSLKKDFFQFLKSPFTYFSVAVFFLFNLLFLTTASSVTNFFYYIPIIFVILIPTLTMQLWKYEKDIVATLPIKKVTLILSKIFSTFFVCLFLLSITFILCIVKKIEISIVLVSLLLLILYSLAAISFCSYVSLKAKNIATGFLISTLTLLLSCGLHSLAIELNLPINILKLCNYFSFSYHFNSASKGILDTRDLFFYICVFVIFIFLSIKKFEKKKIYTTLVLTTFLILLNSTRFFSVIDLTNGKKYSLSNHSEKILTSIEDTVYLTWYKTKNIENYIPELRNVQDFLFNYTNTSKNFVLNNQTVEKQSETMKMLESFGVYPQKLQLNKKDKSTNLDIISAIILECGNKTEIIPFVLNCDTLEYDIAVRLEYFATKKYNAVQIFCGNGLNLQNDYPYLIPCLDSLGFKCIEIKNSFEILHSVPLLLLGANTFNEVDCINVEKFLLNDGNGFFAVSPFEVDVYGDWTISENNNNSFLNLLNNYGINIESNIVLDENCFTLTMQSTEKEMSQYLDYYFWPQNNKEVSFWISPIEVKNKKYEVLKNTSNKSWLITANEYGKIDGSPFNVEKYVNNSVNKNYNYVIKYENKIQGFYEIGESRVDNKLVFSTDVYGSSRMLEYTDTLTNIDFIADSLLWICDKEELLEIKKKNEK